MVPPREGRCASSGARSKRVRAMRTPASSAVTDSVSDGMSEKTRRAGEGSETERPASSATEMAAGSALSAGAQPPSAQVIASAVTPTIGRWVGEPALNVRSAMYTGSPPSKDGALGAREPRLLARGDVARLPGGDDPQWPSSASCRIPDGSGPPTVAGPRRLRTELPVAPSRQGGRIAGYGRVGNRCRRATLSAVPSEYARVRGHPRGTAARPGRGLSRAPEASRSPRPRSGGRASTHHECPTRS